MLEVMDSPAAAVPGYFRVTLDYDNDAESPNDWGGWKLISFGRKHSTYDDPDKYFAGFDQNNDPIPASRSLKGRLERGSAYWLRYYEHSSCWWSLYNGEVPGDRWDGVRLAGVLIYQGNVRDVSHNKDSRRESAKGFVDNYTLWSNGNCYQFGIERLVPPPDAEDFDLKMDSDECEAEHLDSSCGFYGEKDLAFGVQQSLRDAGWKPGDEILFEGEAGWVNKYHRFIPE